MTPLLSKIKEVKIPIVLVHQLIPLTKVVQIVAQLLNCETKVLHDALCQRVNYIKGERFVVGLTPAEVKKKTFFKKMVDPLHPIGISKQRCLEQIYVFHHV